VSTRRDYLQWWQRQETSFWAAATLGVPLLLSATLLLMLLTKLIFEGSGMHILSCRFIPLGVVELLLALGSVWLARRPSNWTTGAAVAGAITGIFTLAAATLTL
jgi:hypothetical protein